MTMVSNRFSNMLLAGACLCMAGTATVSADITLTFERGDSSVMQAAPTGPQVRIDMAGDEAEGEDPTWMLYDAETPAFTFVFPEDEAYRHLQGTSLTAMQAMGKNSGPSAGQLSTRWTDKGATPAGVDCRWAELSYGSMKVAALCLADEDELDVDEDEVAAIRAAMSFGNTLGDLSKHGIKGFPVIMKDDEGITTTLKSVSHDGIPASRFIVPAEYDRLDTGF
jgi:hypothetical protein